MLKGYMARERLGTPELKHGHRKEAKLKTTTNKYLI